MEPVLKNLCRYFGFRRIALLFNSALLHEKVISYNFPLAPGELFAGWNTPVLSRMKAKRFYQVSAFSALFPEVFADRSAWLICRCAGGSLESSFYVLAEVNDPSTAQPFCRSASGRGAIDILELIVDNYASSLKLGARVAHLNILVKFGAALSHTLDLDQLYWKIYQFVKEVMDADAFFIGLLLEDKPGMDLPFIMDEGKRYPRAIEPLGEGAGSRAVTTGRPIILNRTPAEVKKLEKNIEAVNVFGNVARISRSLLASPIVNHGRIIGVISTQSYRYESYNQDHLDLLQTIASQAGTAIENARLYQEQLKRSKVLDVVDEINQKAWHIEEPETIIVKFLRLLKYHFGKYSYAFLYHEEGSESWREFDFRTDERVPPEPNEKPAFLENEVLRQAFEQKAAAIRNAPIECAWVRRVFEAVPKSMLVIPMVIEHEVQGILVIGDQLQRAFSQEDAKWFEIILSRLGLIFQRISLLRSTARERDRFLAILDHLNAGVHILDEEMNIVFANKWAQNQRLPGAKGRKCFEAFFDLQSPCPACPLAQSALLTQDSQFVMTTIEERSFQVSLSKFKGVDGRLQTLEILQEITEQKQADDKKIKMERMETVMAMAGTIGHELNQPLTGITGLVSLILEELGPDDPHFASLQEIDRQSMRLSDLIKKFQRIARIEKMQYPGKEIVDLERSIQ